MGVYIKPLFEDSLSSRTNPLEAFFFEIFTFLFFWGTI